jgi:hypothetical protein
MLRERSEIIAFSRDDLERIVRHVAKQQITSSMFIGKFGEQSIRWTAEGGVEVITKYQEGDMTDLPPPVETPELLAAPTKKKRK